MSGEMPIVPLRQQKSQCKGAELTVPNLKYEKVEFRRQSQKIKVGEGKSKRLCDVLWAARQKLRGVAVAPQSVPMMLWGTPDVGKHTESAYILNMN